jgi:hypothetical protein
MDRKLHLLESFAVRGSDGRQYTVRGYEHMVHLGEAVPAAAEQWEPTGKVEYKLGDGRHVDMNPDGSFTVAGTTLKLEREQA